MAVEISFRQAKQSDRAFLLSLRKLSMFEHLEKAGISLNDEEHLQRIDEFFNDSYLILKNNLMIGVIKLGLFPERIHIRQFQILPEYQGAGIGNKVLDVVKKKAKERQCAITLNVLLNNPAKTLYLRHEFVVVSQNKLEFHMRWSLKYTFRY